MQIKKRNGDVVAFDVEKIRAAMRKAFAATGVGIEESELDKLSLAVQQSVEKATALTVENVQDRVEQELMAAGYYETAKAYVLYREERAKLRRARESIAAQFKDPSLERVLREIERDFSSPAYVYISTPHTGLYEKYGYDFHRHANDYLGNACRVYRKEVS